MGLRPEPNPEPLPEGKAAPLSIDAQEVAALVKRGQDYLQNGDIVSARLMLKRAANAGDAQAALLLGATFDPTVLRDLGVLGFTPDPAQARTWYQRAADAGLPEATRRLERLLKTAR
jgi:TPR repeat protein